MSQQASAKYLKGATGDWEIVIGMEIHAQVTSKAKLFLAHQPNMAELQMIMYRSLTLQCQGCCRL